MATLKLTPYRKNVLLKVAKSARNMARRCKAGTAKHIGQGKCFRKGKAECVFGHVLANAFPGHEIKGNLLGNDEALGRFLRMKHYLDLPDSLTDSLDEIAATNDHASCNEQLQETVVEPLRQLASTIQKAVKQDEWPDDGFPADNN